MRYSAKLLFMAMTAFLLTAYSSIPSTWKLPVKVVDSKGSPVKGATVKLFMIKSNLVAAQGTTDKNGQVTLSLDISKPPLDMTPMRLFLAVDPPSGKYMGMFEPLKGAPKSLYTLTLFAKTNQEIPKWKKQLLPAIAAALDLGVNSLKLVSKNIKGDFYICPLLTGDPTCVLPSGVDLNTVTFGLYNKSMKIYGYGMPTAI